MGMTYKSITRTSGLCLKVVSYSNGGVVVVAVWIELRTGVRHAVAASGTSLYRGREFDEGKFTRVLLAVPEKSSRRSPD